jgi:hypothetical protein
MALNTFAFLKKKKRFWWGLKAEKALIETKFCFNTRREWPMKIPLGFCFLFFFLLQCQSKMSRRTINFA